MNIDFTTQLTNLDGTPAEDEHKQAITLGSLAINALLALDPRRPATEKLAAYELAMRLHRGTTEISIDDAKLLKDRIGESYGPLTMGQAFHLLETS